MIELVMVFAELILVGVLEAVAYVVMWAILVPCSFVAATPVVLALALIRPGSFRENARRDYGAIYRSLDGIVDWTRRDGPKTSRR